MTRDEAIEAIETLKEQGETDQDIMSTFYRMFADDKLTLKEFSNLLNLLGYELSEEFLSMSPEEQKTSGWDEDDDEDEYDEDEYDEYCALVNELGKKGYTEYEILKTLYKKLLDDEVSEGVFRDIMSDLECDLSDLILSLSKKEQKEIYNKYFSKKQ